MKDWVKEWYNDQFNKIDISPSSSVWDNISRTMEDWPKHWYAANATDLGTKPRKQTWENLQQNLAHQNNIRLSNRFTYGLASVIAIVLLVIPFKIDDWNYNNSFGSLTSNELSDGSFTEKSDLSRNVSSNVDRTLDRRTGLSNQENDRTRLSNLQLEPKLFEFEVRTSSNEMNLVSANRSTDVRPEPILAELPILNSLNKGQSKRELIKPNRYSIKGNSISVAVSPQLSVLNNPLTQNALNSENENIALLPSMTYMVTAGRKFNERNGVTLALLMNNKKSMSTNSYDDQRSISLNYTSLAALYTASWKIGNKGRFRFNTEAGLIAGLSTQSTVMFNEERINYLEEGYGALDAGVMLGTSLSTSLNDQWSIEAGINSQIGLINIFKGTDQIPADYFKTNTQSIGFNLGITRRF